jgi:hypothetical protein
VVEELPIEVDPKRVVINVDGFAWRTVLVRMPERATQESLREPKIWRRAQCSPQSALKERDHLEKVGSYRDKGSTFFNDGTLEVFWDGAAYGVRRIADQVRLISEGFLTEGQAIAALRNWYPKKAG